MHKYKEQDFSVKKLNKKNIEQSVIEVSNLSNEFTIEHLVSQENELKKLLSEVSSQISISSAMCKNIVKNNSMISSLGDDLLHAIWMYKDNKDVEDRAKNKKKEVEKQLNEYKEAFKFIEKLTGYKKDEKRN